ncbi:hypothetical protein F9288_08850 [Sphingomonas sp. CL5.1]|uniref:membrane dipeptidase n=1 Tax=Sphingomonas sp. CL5.1 TaxID=2653203 RepID=UPI001582EBAA|nr:membrane dipeptidase [Sphingomonas sp. CL5.1]QKR99736.1 hypothetical protein F9288_08850 [Sphingomonas sp. CL5.1]
MRLHRQGKIAALLTVEGGDFLAGDASYLDTAFADGVRAITLVHYHPNELGDNQMAPPRSRLTAFGREVVRGMDRLGMVMARATLPGPLGSSLPSPASTKAGSP